jgi:hypothetical protein
MFAELHFVKKRIKSDYVTVLDRLDPESMALEYARQVIGALIK